MSKPTKKQIKEVKDELNKRLEELHSFINGANEKMRENDIHIEITGICRTEVSYENKDGGESVDGCGFTIYAENDHFDMLNSFYERMVN